MKDKKLRKFLGVEEAANGSLIGVSLTFLADTIGRLRAQINMITYGQNIVTCEGCGCLLRQFSAIEGESILKEGVLPNSSTGNCYPAIGKYIFTPYYCGRCNPKKRKKK